MNKQLLLKIIPTRLTKKSNIRLVTLITIINLFYCMNIKYIMYKSIFFFKIFSVTYK